MRLASLIILLSIAATAPVYGDTEAVSPQAVAKARSAFVERMVTEHGFERADVEAILGQAHILPAVLQAASKPAERIVPWYRYRDIFVKPERIDLGARFWRAHAELIARVAAAHRVDPAIIVAILGIETRFGQRTGSYRVLDALATLAFAYPPRSAFFADQLEQFLLMSREEGKGVLQVRGSYAGAMGAPQFIPSSFRAYAVDEDGDGRRDIWGDWADVLGSIANYFERHGWQAGQPVAARAGRTQASGAAPIGATDRFRLDATVGELSAQGYVFSSELPGSAAAAAFALQRDPRDAEYWVGFHNFEVITRYNRSIKYALAAYQLSRAILTAYQATSGSVAP